MKLIWNKADCIRKYCGITIYAAPRGHPPFPCQTIVEEQDTDLLLQHQTFIRDPGKPAWYLANVLDTKEHYRLGDIIIKGQTPKRLLAIVHDIEELPTCTADTIALAYQNLMTCVEQEDFSSIAVPLLGTVHGKISITESIKLLGNAIQQNPPACLQQVWIILPDDQECDCLELLNDSA